MRIVLLYTCIPTTQRLFLPPATKLGQGYVFTRVCDSVHGAGCLPQCMLGYTPRGQTSPQEQTPPAADPPGSSACWEIRATRGRYASYWNAYFFPYHFAL